MAAKIQLQHAQEATSDMVNAYREINQAVADNLVTQQGSYLRFTHSLFQTWRDMFTLQIPQAPRRQTVGRPPQKQQDPCHRLISAQPQRKESNQSEVAALRERLDKEYEAYKLFCNGFAMTASHAAITTRMQVFSERVGEIQATLVPLVGDEQATRIIGRALQDKVT